MIMLPLPTHEQKLMRKGANATAHLYQLLQRLPVSFHAEAPHVQKHKLAGT